MLEKQLRLKFNDLDGPLIQRLYNASPEELDCWAERVLFASTLEEVFNNGQKASELPGSLC